MTIKPQNETLRAGLQAYMENNNLTLAELARELDSTPSPVSKYLNQKPEGDVLKLEAKIEDVIKNASRRRTSKNDVFSTAVTRQIAGTFETIRETNDIGLIFGPAGIGKTCACELYTRSHPVAVMVTASQMTATGQALQRAVFNAVGSSSWRGNTARADWLVQKFQGSNRLLIVDNAQRLSLSGLQWFFDFLDATGCPGALVGNPEVLQAIRKSDQQFSRIGLKTEIKPAGVKAAEIKRVAAEMITQLLPESGAELQAVAEIVAERHGHFRSLRKQLLLTRKIKENAAAAGTEASWEQAFRSAHTQLVRDYSL